MPADNEVPGAGLRPGGYGQAVRTRDPLVVFLYVLMRDHLVCGDVESLVHDAAATTETSFSNDFLAAYAYDLADRLSRADPVAALASAHARLRRALATVTPSEGFDQAQ